MKYTSAQQLVEDIQSAARQAIKDKDTQKVNALQSLLTAFTNAEAVPLTTDSAQGTGSTEAPRKDLSLQDLQDIINREISDLEQLVTQIGPNNSYTVQLQRTITVLAQYAPSNKK